MDNRWVVPCCPFLTLRYDAHINVEICSSVRAVKYLYKYVFKGNDRALAAITQPEGAADEIPNFVINTSYQKLPFGSGDYPDRLLYHQALN